MRGGLCLLPTARAASGGVTSSGICGENKDGTLTHYWMEMNACRDWRLAALTTEQKARQASDHPHRPPLAASQINNSVQSALVDFIFSLNAPPPALPPDLITADWKDSHDAPPVADRSVGGDLILFSREHGRFSVTRFYSDTRLVSFTEALLTFSTCG